MQIGERQLPAKAKASIGGFDGAKQYTREFSTWRPTIESPDVSYLPDKTTAVGRIEDSVRNDPYLKGALRDRKDAIVGDNYLLTSLPDSRVLFGKRDEVWESEFAEEVEAWWTISTKSETWLDAARKQDFTELVRLGTGIKLLRGEVFAAFEYITDSNRPFSTALNFISGDRIGNNGITTTQANTRDGIKTDAYGAPISYFVSSQDPYDFGLGFLGYTAETTWKEIPKYTPWGRLQMLHVFSQEGAAQTRGIPQLVTGLKTLRVFKDLNELSLQRAVVAASVIGTITSDMPTDKLFTALGMDSPANATLSPNDITKRVDDFVAGYFNSVIEGGSTSVNGVRLPHLYPNTKLEFHNLGRDQEIGSDFGKSMLRCIAALTGTSYEEYAHDLSGISYSGLKGAFALTRKSVLSEKKQTSDEIANAGFKAWLEEMICKRTFTTLPKRFCNLKYLWSNPFRMHALAKAHWIGASAIQVDELKESTASALKLQNGLSTWSAELAKSGQPWQSVFRQMAREQQLAKDLNLDISAGTVNAVKPIISKTPNVDHTETGETDSETNED